MNTPDFRDYLTDALSIRQRKNPAYSMRAFARDLGMSAQKLNQVLKKKCGLSPQAASEIASKIGLTSSQRELFVALVESRHHRSRTVRELARNRVEKLLSRLDFEKIPKSSLNLFESWTLLAAYLLVDVDDFSSERSWIASRLGISAEQVREAYDKLFEAGLLTEVDGKWKRSRVALDFSFDGSSKILQNYYRQLWARAEFTMEGERPENREFSASTISVSLDDVEFVRQEMEAFRKNLIQSIAKRPGNAERVYALTMQFFPLDRRGLQ